MRPPVPPFTEETARAKVQAAEDAWNTRDPEKVAAAYTPDSQWRNRDEFFTGRDAIVAFLRGKWEREGEYALRKDLWAFTADRIAVRFQYESRDASGQWWRSYGNEQWEFDAEGYMRRREASINDVAIEESERRIFGPRPDAERGAPLPLAWRSHFRDRSAGCGSTTPGGCPREPRRDRGNRGLPTRAPARTAGRHLRPGAGAAGPAKPGSTSSPCPAAASARARAPSGRSSRRPGSPSPCRSRAA